MRRGAHLTAGLPTVLQAQKLVHTDLKPENILLLESGYDRDPIEPARCPAAARQHASLTAPRRRGQVV
jgi:serine/threonine protein kinase